MASTMFPSPSSSISQFPVRSNLLVQISQSSSSATTTTSSFVYATRSLSFSNESTRSATRHWSVSRRPICPVYSSSSLHANYLNNTQYEFSDGKSDVELRLELKEPETPTAKDIIVDVEEYSLSIGVRSSGSVRTLVETKQLYDRIKPGETIWYLDDNQLVISLKKHDPELKWPDIVESWESLTVGVAELLQGTAIYLVGDSTDINDKVARELAVGLRYTPLDTRGFLESLSKQSVDSWIDSEGHDPVAEAESAVLENLSSHVRVVVATLGGKEGAAMRTDGWRYLYSGFTVWISPSDATDEDSAKEEAKRQIDDGSSAYSKAEVVVKLGGWDPNHAKAVAQACLSALKQLILSDNKLPGKKNLYIRLGCRGDWPNINPPGWDPSSGSAPPNP